MSLLKKIWEVKQKISRLKMGALIRGSGYNLCATWEGLDLLPITNEKTPWGSSITYGVLPSTQGD